MANNVATITFLSDYVEDDYLDLAISEAGIPPTLGNLEFLWEDIPDPMSTNPYEVQTLPPSAGVAGQATAVALANRLLTVSDRFDFHVTQFQNTVTITILTAGFNFVLGRSTDADIEFSRSDDALGGDLAVITFTSEGIDTTQLTMTIITAGVGLGPLLVYDWTATPTNPYDVQVVPTTGLIGSATARQFADAFNATQNTLLDYTVTVVNNVVTIRSTNPDLTIDWEISNTAGTADVIPVTNSLVVDAEILGQEIGEVSTYCYLYEPLRVAILDWSLAATKIFIELQIIDTADNTTIIDTQTEYGEFDVNPTKRVSVDLMKIARQYHDANIFHYSSVDEIVEDTIGWNSVVSKYRYNFIITTNDVAALPKTISKIPIIGVREYEEFTPVVSEAEALTEFEYFGVDVSSRWKNFPTIANELVGASLQNAAPIITKTVQTTLGKEPCGGYVIWKSRRGGWMYWGFDIKTKTKTHAYSESLAGGYFESTKDFGGSPYIPVDYTGVETSYSISLKSLSLSSLELQAVSGINSTTAVYYMKDSTSPLELMRVSAINTPLSNQANGGDFSITLGSITTASQKTR